MIPFRFHPQARVELREAIAWYAERSFDAAIGLADSVEVAIRKIREHPHAWQQWHGNSEVSVRITRGYPFLVVYIPLAQEILILAIAHQRRRPGYWLARTTSR